MLSRLLSPERQQVARANYLGKSSQGMQGAQGSSVAGRDGLDRSPQLLLAVRPTVPYDVSKVCIYERK
jgi:hypothetical protein